MQNCDFDDISLLDSIKRVLLTVTMAICIGRIDGKDLWRIRSVKLDSYTKTNKSEFKNIAAIFSELRTEKENEINSNLFIKLLCFVQSVRASVITLFSKLATLHTK